MNTQVAFAPKAVMARKDMDIRAGDTVRVHVKIEERGKTRTQVFEGLVIATKHGSEPGATFTVRKISNGVGIERIFPLYSPVIEKIEVVKRARVRKAKLYYIREKVARDIRRKMRNLVAFTASTDDLVPVEEMIEEEAAPESDVTTETENQEDAAPEEAPVEAETAEESAAEEEAPVAESEEAPESDTPEEKAPEEEKTSE